MPTGALDVMAGVSSGRRRARATDDPIAQWKHIRCLFYRIYDGLTVAEVARRMGVTERTVERWTQYALGYYGHPEIKVIREMIRKMDRTI